MRLHISVMVPDQELQMRLYISHIKEVGTVNALNCWVLGLHITKDEIIIAVIGRSEAGLV